METSVMAECENCKLLRAQLAAADGILSHNMSVANGTARRVMEERDKIIRNLRKQYSAIEIAHQVGLTRQRVHQILNESPDSASSEQTK